MYKVLLAVTFLGMSASAQADLGVKNVECRAFINGKKLALKKQSLVGQDVYSVDDVNQGPAGLDLGIGVEAGGGISIVIEDLATGKKAHTWSNVIGSAANVEYGGLMATCTYLKN